MSESYQHFMPHPAPKWATDEDVAKWIRAYAALTPEQQDEVDVKLELRRLRDGPLVELWGIYGDEDALFICAGPTGVRYTNQVGGTCCAHPELEGFAVPIRVQEEEAAHLDAATSDMCLYGSEPFDGCNSFWGHGLDQVNEATKDALNKSGLSVVFELLSDENRKLMETAIISRSRVWEEDVWFAEAWLPVQVRSDIAEGGAEKWPNQTILSDLAGRWGVLTWVNSD